MIKNAFTLIELMVVISIISLLSSVIFSSVSDARINAQDIKRIVEARNLATAAEIYSLDFSYYPSPSSANFDPISGVNANDASGLYVEADAQTGAGFEEILQTVQPNAVIEESTEYPREYLCIDNEQDGTCDKGYFLPKVKKTNNAVRCPRFDGLSGFMSQVLCMEEVVEQITVCDINSEDDEYLDHYIEGRNPDEYSLDTSDPFSTTYYGKYSIRVPYWGIMEGAGDFGEDIHACGSAIRYIGPGDSSGATPLVDFIECSNYFDVDAVSDQAFLRELAESNIKIANSGEFDASQCPGTSLPFEGVW